MIELYIETTEKEIVLKLKNSKPKCHIENVVSNKKSMGMQNTEKQLDLLYPNTYELEVNDSVLEYTLELKLKLHEKI